MFTHISVTNSLFQINWGEKVIAWLIWTSIYTSEQSSTNIYITSRHRIFCFTENHTNLFLRKFCFNYLFCPWIHYQRNKVTPNFKEHLYTKCGAFEGVCSREGRIQNGNRQAYLSTNTNCKNTADFCCLLKQTNKQINK